MLGQGSVQIRLGNGAGAFTDPVDIYTGGGPRSLAVRDVNADLKLDIAVANTGTGGITMLIGNGNGTFTFGPTLSTGTGHPAEVIIDTLDRGSKPDVAAVMTDTNALTVWPGNNNGTFGSGRISTISSPTALASYDVSNDNKKDVVVASYANDLVTVMLGDRTGFFTPGSTYVHNGANSVALANKLNKDNKIDMVVANKDDGTVSLRLGNGDGTFQAAKNWDAPAAEVVRIFDVTTQAKDIIVTSASGDKLVVMLGYGNGIGPFGTGFDLPKTFDVGDSPAGFTVGNFDNTSMKDVAVANSGGGNLSILINLMPQSEA